MRRAHARCCAVLALAALLSTGALAQAARRAVSPAAPGAPGAIVTVEVFANSAMHVTPEPSAKLPYQLKVYRVDALRNIEAAINQQLPQTEAEARAWMAANEGRIRRQLQPQIASAANGITLATAYRINRIPAIVINRQVVVYGVTDANQAIELARQRAAGGRS